MDSPDLNNDIQIIANDLYESIELYIKKINSSELNLAYKLLTDSSKKNKYQNRIDEVIDRIKVAKRLYVFELVNYLHANVAGIIVEYLYFYEY